MVGIDRDLQRLRGDRADGARQRGGRQFVVGGFRAGQREAGRGDELALSDVLAVVAGAGGHGGELVAVDQSGERERAADRGVGAAVVDLGHRSGEIGGDHSPCHGERAVDELQRIAGRRRKIAEPQRQRIAAGVGGDARPGRSERRRAEQLILREHVAEGGSVDEAADDIVAAERRRVEVDRVAVGLALGGGGERGRRRLTEGVAVAAGTAAGQRREAAGGEAGEGLAPDRALVAEQAAEAVRRRRRRIDQPLAIVGGAQRAGARFVDEAAVADQFGARAVDDIGEVAGERDAVAGDDPNGFVGVAHALAAQDDVAADPA